MSKRCTSCLINTDAKFCTECGQATVDAPAPSHSTSGGYACTKCGTSFASSQKFCSECGGSVAISQPAAKVGGCPSCHGDNLPNAKFCVHCGQTLGGSPAKPQTTAVQRGYIPPDHTSHIPVVPEAPKVSGRLKAYRPPDHTANIPVVKEVADVYTGQYQTTTDVSSQRQ